MLIKRMIPIIQINADMQAVKTVQFNKRNYVGDPVNLLKIYNDLGVDEVGIWAIDSKTHCWDQLSALLREIAVEARMPLSYGGGLTSMSFVTSVISMGFEKVAFSFSSWQASEVPLNAVYKLGTSCVQAVINVREGILGDYFAVCHHTRSRIGRLEDAVSFVIEKGAGEIVVQSIDRDGTRRGLDLKISEAIRKLNTRVPVILAGGLGTHTQAIQATKSHGLSGIASGTCFTFSSARNGVLPSYPSDLERGLWCPAAEESK